MERITRWTRKKTQTKEKGGGIEGIQEKNTKMARKTEDDKQK